MTFWLKKLAALSLMPLSLCLGAVWVGVALWWVKGRSAASHVVVAAAALVLTVLSFGAVTNAIIKPLESRYPPLTETGGLTQVKWVAVLGGGHASNPQWPANAQLGSSSLSRLVEGIRIHRQLPDSKLLLSGGAVFDTVPEAETMAAVARILGVATDALVLETRSRDTGEQAAFIREMVHDQPCVVVTSAVHMPRAMLVFEKQGLKPIPAPADFEEMPRETSPFHFLPRAAALSRTESALHEYLGCLWELLRG